ncbi:MAG TPA: hypothetical protein VIN08_02670 [Ohtaekwangia sp.]|uniref:hypothetical protein n=1 Tax=Ohtaekwangia sp. TaxID=2066019 RepID=UPI002F93A517
MKNSAILLCFLSYSFLPTGCQQQNEKKKEVHIFCDNFPELKIDSITTDTARFRKYIETALAANSTDSIQFVIECPDNIVLESITQTENILKEQIDLSKNKRPGKIIVYNKCLSELSLPLGKVNQRPANLIVRADINGNLSIDNNSITLDSICQKYRRQNITIEIVADNRLSMDKFSEILKRLETEHFIVYLGQ